MAKIAPIILQRILRKVSIVCLSLKEPETSAMADLQSLEDKV